MTIQKKLDAIAKPQSIEELSLVEVLDIEFGIKSAELNGELQLLDDAEMPSEEELLIAKQNLLQKYNNNIYAKERKVSYPSIGEQLDALYRDILNGTLTEDGEFCQMIAEIKSRYPKPNIS